MSFSLPVPDAFHSRFQMLPLLRRIMVASSSSSLSWACNCCTFLNSPSRTSSCQVCLFSVPVASSPSFSSSSSTLSDVCRACTFSNPTVLPSSRASLLAELEPEPCELADPAIGSIFRPLRRCGTKRPASLGSITVTQISSDAASPKLPRVGGDPQEQQTVALSSPVLGDVSMNPNRCIIKILSYNVWFRKYLELSGRIEALLHGRMEALGNLIEQYAPDFICFQEVTPNIYAIFQKSNWWKHYICSLPQQIAAQRRYFCMQMSKLPVKEFSRVPFANSEMERELCLAEVEVGEKQSLIIATSHLESPCPSPPSWDQMYSKERVAQAKLAIDILVGSDSPNVILAGDMNWDDKLDGAFPLPDGWVDAWLELKPGENGWTYDTKANQMLSANRTLQKRLDRFICYLPDFKMDGIEMIGMEAIPGLFYRKEKKVKKELRQLVLPVLPSDHYGLLLTIHLS